MPLIRIEISHPVTDEPTWLQDWDGSEVTTTHLENADPEAGDLDDWGGYEFNAEYEATFSTWSPREVAEHIIDLQEGAGFSARLLPPNPRMRALPPPRPRYKALQRSPVLLRQLEPAPTGRSRIPSINTHPILFSCSRVILSPAPVSMHRVPK